MSITVHARPQRSGPESNRLRALLRDWRARRGVSQLALALEMDVSQRHLSFIEAGRARPSREMVLRIATTLDLPLRARNDLLAAAGFAAVFPERPLDAADMTMVRDALDRILRHQEPYPAMVLDRHWNIIMRNAANARVVDRLVDTDAFAARAADGKLNFLRVMFAADGIRPHVINWSAVGSGLIARLRREAAANPGSPSEALLEELGPLAPAPPLPPGDEHALPTAAPLELNIGGTVLRLVNMLTTFGTPQDVSVQELRIEMSFPADKETDASLRGWEQSPAPSAHGAV
jgi:transcriptional regulator with XRE-family HTH domain